MFFLKPNVKKLLEKKNEAGLIKALSHKDPDIRGQALNALVELGTPESLAVVKEIFKNDQPRFDALLSRFEAGIGPEKEAVAYFYERIKKEDETGTL